MKKLHVAVSVTFENKSIQAKSGDRPAAEGIDLIAAFKVDRDDDLRLGYS